MTQKKCTRCGVALDEENYGVSLYDDHVMLERHDNVILCVECREGLEDWLQEE